MTTWALNQKNIALEAELKAENARIEAVKEKENVLREKNRADSLLLIAEREKQKAIESLEKFTKQKALTSKAEKERNQQELKRLISLANGYIINGRCHLAMKELKKALSIGSSNKRVMRLIEECENN